MGQRDAALVEALDGASSYLWTAEAEAVKAWIAEHGVTPPLSIGSRVSCYRGTGEITRIDEDRGMYVVLPDAERNDPKFSRGGGWLINYDDATEVAEAACPPLPPIEARRVETGTGSMRSTKAG